MRGYLAGPMTGIPQFNFPAFDREAQAKRAQGHDVVSPAELDDPETRELALSSDTGAMGTGSHADQTWGDFLARDVKMIADGGIECIWVMRGWARSRGARLETFIGRALCGFPIYKTNGRRVRLWRLVIAWAVGR